MGISFISDCRIFHGLLLSRLDFFIRPALLQAFHKMIQDSSPWCAHFGYAPTPKWEFDIRYDVLNRLTDVSAAERKFEALTLGTQYFLNTKARSCSTMNCVMQRRLIYPAVLHRIRFWMKLMIVWLYNC